MTGNRSGPTASDGAGDGPWAGDGGSPVDPGSGWTQVAQRSYDPDLGEELTTTIVFALAAAKDVEPIEVGPPPLYEVVDASALEETLYGSGEVSAERNGAAEFRYDGYLVEVGSGGWVQIYERADVDEQ